MKSDTKFLTDGDLVLRIEGRTMEIQMEADDLQLISLYRLKGVEVVPSDDTLRAILHLVRAGASLSGLREVVRPLFTALPSRAEKFA